MFFYVLSNPTRLLNFGEGLPSYKSSLFDIDKFISPSIFVADIISKKIQREVEVIPNFVPQVFNNKLASGFSNFFLYAGVIEPHKGVFDLIKKYSEIFNKIDKKLIIVGNVLF